MILRLKCKSPISGVSYWRIKVRTGRGAPYSDFPKIMTVNLCLPTYKDKADPLLPPKIYFVSCICKGPAMEAQLFYRGTERKVQNTFNYESARLCIFKLWMGNHYFTHHCSQTLAVPFSLGRRRSKWQAVGSLEENKIRTQVIYSFILRPWQRSDTVVLELDISPPSSSLPVVLVFCHLLKASSELKIFAHLQQLNHSTFDWVFKRFIGSDAYWVQRERCAEIWGFWSQIQVMYKEKSFSTMAASRALHLLKMAFMLLLHAVKSQIM